MPVFLLIGAGYAAVWTRMLSQSAVEGLMKFAQRFAIPCMLFYAISDMNLRQGFEIRFVTAFYVGSLASFTCGLLGARFLFHRDWEDAVVVGFAALFGNTVLLGLSIVGRAYGGAALDGTYALVSMHAPFCYLVGISAMELIRSQTTGFLATARAVLAGMFRNAIMLGIFAGFVFNVLNIPLPVLVGEALEMIAQSALPVALVGLGGILVQYRPEGDMKLIAYICALSLGLHPFVAWLFASEVFAINQDFVRSAVITSAMAPGINAYIFATLYSRAQRVTASSVLFATLFSIFTASAWLWLLG